MAALASSLILTPPLAFVSFPVGILNPRAGLQSNLRLLVPPAADCDECPLLGSFLVEAGLGFGSAVTHVCSPEWFFASLTLQGAK